MAKFKCKVSGVVIEFVSEVDIKSMQGHPDYDMLDEEDKVVEVEEKVQALPLTAPKRGRPAKG